MSVQASVEIIAICMLVIGFGAIVTTMIMTLVGLRISSAISTTTKKAQPLISQATETVKTVNVMAQTVKDHTESIMNKAEDTVNTVSNKVKTTANIVQDSINPPLISAASVITGVSRGLEILSQTRHRRGNGHAS